MLESLATEAVRFHPISPAATLSLNIRKWVSADCIDIIQVERGTMFLYNSSTVALL